MIDAHVHCWDTALFDLEWLDAFPSLPKRRLLEDYTMAGTRAVSSVVLVEASPRPGRATEAAWLADAASGSTPPVAGVVASLPVKRGRDIAAELDELLEAVPLVCGIRRNLEAMPPRTWHDESFRAGVAAIDERGLPFDLSASGPTLSDAVELVAALPEVRFVLEHIGKPPRPTDHRTRAS